LSDYCEQILLILNTNKTGKSST